MEKNYFDYKNILATINGKYFFSLFLFFIFYATVFGQISQNFTTSGTFIVPAGITSITVQAWGAGAGGNNNISRGGGGGAFAQSTLTVVPGTSYTVTVGAGGTAGNNGQNSSFGNLVVASGAIGAIGGLASTSTGTVKWSGGAGGTSTGNGGAGGGAAAGTTNNGANGGNTTNNNGGAGGTGINGGGNGGNGGNSNGNGVNGFTPGGGGGERGQSGTSSASGGNGQIIVTYTPRYAAQFISANTGSATWCAGETRTVSVTIKNVGSQSWTDVPGGDDFNIGIKWNTNNPSWNDYNVRVDAKNLAPGATTTYYFNITASNNTGAYTTPLAAGTNNLNFDVVYEGVAWFGNNNTAVGVGPGNSVFTTSNITIIGAPVTPTVAGAATICSGASTSIKGASTGNIIDWYSAATGGVLLGSSASSNTNNFSVSPTVTTTYYAEARNTTTGCISTTRSDVTVTVNPQPSPSDAGLDQANTNATSFTMAANTPAVGTGAWTIVSGPNTALGQFSSTTNPRATFTPATPGTYVLNWAVSNSCGSNSDQVVITNNCITNMITNGDFSNGSTGWTFAGIPGSDRVEVNTENTYFSNSNPSLTAELDSEASLRQVITVIPGVSYTVGFRYARRPTSGTPATTGVTVRVTGGAPTISTGFTTTSTTPQVGSFTFIPTTTTTVGIEFYNHLSGGITLGTIIDDIVLLPASQANPYAVTNPRGAFNTTTACAGVAVSLDVENAPAGATYLWTGTGGAVFSSTTIKTPTVTFSSSGLQSATVTVTSASGCAVTSTTYVNVTPAPVITGPGASAICSGSTYSSGAITSTGVSYDWSRSGVTGINNGAAATGGSNIAKATGFTEILTNSTNDPINVTYVLTPRWSTNSCAGIPYNLVVTVNPSTAISSQSTATQTVCLNAAFSPITVTATGVGLTYQWYRNTTASTTGGISLGSANGAQTNSYTPQSTTAETLYYYVVVSGTCGNVTSAISGAFVTNPLTAISSQSTAGQIRCLNTAFSTITVTATGVGLTYQWYSNTSSSTTGGTSLGAANGAQTNSYTPQSTTVGTLYYYVVVSGTCGNVTSGVSGAFVTNVPSVPTLGTVIQPNCSVMTGSINLSNLPPSGTIFQTIGSVTTNIPITGGGTQTITGLAAGSYTFTVSNGSCTSGSTSATVINDPPAVAIWNGTFWLPNPTINHRVEFRGNYTSGNTGPVSPANVDACSCYVKNNAVVIFNPGHTLNVINEVVVESGGSLTFENNASLVQHNENPNINLGNILYKRITTPVNRYDYTYWSSPVNTMTLGMLSPTTFFDKYFSYNNAWVAASRVTPMVKGQGYSVRAPQTTAISGNPLPFLATFTGVPHNGVVTLSGLAASQAHLLGNPYPSAIDADVFLNLNSNLNVAEELRVLEGTLYFWTHNTPPSTAIPGDKKYNYTTNDYATYNRTGGVGTAAKVHSLNYPAGVGNTNFSIPTGNIAAGQGFFAPAKAGGTVVFNNTMRISGGGVNGINEGKGDDNSQFFKLSNGKTAKITVAKTEKNRIWLNLSNSEGAFKQTLIGYITGATNYYEGAFDGMTYDGNQYIDFYSVNNGVNLAIQGRALPFVKKDSITLGYKSTIKGDFQISIDQIDGALTTQNVFLEDKDLKVQHDLKKEAYTFSTEKGVFNNRFVLRYADKNAVDEVIVPEIPGEESNAAVIVSVKDGEIKINANVTKLDKVVVYDIAGRRLFQKNKIEANVFFIPNMVWNHQALIVDIVLTDGTKHSRKIIN